jgi:hypothetical protein
VSETDLWQNIALALFVVLHIIQICINYHLLGSDRALGDRVTHVVNHLTDCR